MTPFVARIVSAVLTVTLSVAFGFLPALLAWRCAHVLPTPPAAGHDSNSGKAGRNRWLAFLLNLGGGVLLANCFCHWLPEVREGSVEIHNTTLLIVFPSEMTSVMA
jgi:hypothetical protein